jgi:hypothetical protein
MSSVSGTDCLGLGESETIASGWVRSPAMTERPPPNRRHAQSASVSPSTTSTCPSRKDRDGTPAAAYRAATWLHASVSG